MSAYKKLEPAIKVGQETIDKLRDERDTALHKASQVRRELEALKQKGREYFAALEAEENDPRPFMTSHIEIVEARQAAEAALREAVK